MSSYTSVEVSGLKMRYGTKDVLHGVDFTIARGEVLVLLGPNGAGKTTTIEILEGFRIPSAGTVRVLDADPARRWLRGHLAMDDKGFVRTGADLTGETLEKWPLSRPPLLFETSLPRVFAAGDVRASSVKRVASAVGEGSVCIQLVHRVLSE